MTYRCPNWSIRYFLLFTGFVALCSLLSAYVAQYLFHVEPCVLCLYERYFYGATVLAGLLCLLIKNERFLSTLFMLVGLILLGGLILGIYHLGVEEHWWQGTAACHGAPKAQTLEDFRRGLVGRQSARCDQINWRILGVSATWWNLAWFAGFGGLWGLTFQNKQK